MTQLKLASAQDAVKRPKSVERLAAEFGWPQMVDAARQYGKRLSERPSKARIRMLAGLMREHPDRPSVCADVVHGYVAFHWSSGDDFDRARYMVPETLCRPSNRDKYLEAYDEGVDDGGSPPWPSAPVRRVRGNDWDAELREAVFGKPHPGDATF